MALGANYGRQRIELLAGCHFGQHFQEVLRASDYILRELAHFLIFQKPIDPPPYDLTVHTELLNTSFLVRVVVLIYGVSVIY